ncbi:pheromone-binding protein-related protein 6-like isoform X1 [Cephus cinctus]|uniref:Pheromone-binding protein-related protein 6-like isoform X1 n=1 Tax=Cephus cinctus TaxID=211228 RepID=A0AAJ7BJ50_CEPCN|nr:pheromone-binding protein-related protein 6-like isoform X1 [Cephus cinctus]
MRVEIKLNKHIRSTMRIFGVVAVACILQASIVHCGTRPSFVSDDMIAMAASVVNACQTETGVSTADIEAVRNGQWSEERSLKCYMYCLWEQFGLVDDKRELSLNGMLTFFQRIPAFRAEVLKAVNTCKRIGKYFANGDNCEYAYTFNKCYAEQSPRTYYLF